MNEQSIKATLEKAIEALFDEQPDIFAFTSATNQTEWSLVNHLATTIAPFFPGFSHDVDLNKPDAGNRRPDIVFHRRKTHDQNLLVIEVKRDKGNAAIKAEMEKIERYWFAKPYLYQFGAVINLNTNHSYKVEVRANPRNISNR